MIYIISGIAKSGKTLITSRLRDRLKIGSFSSDYLMMMLANTNPKLGVNPDASDRSVSHVLEPYLRNLIKIMIANHLDYILEGVHFQPHLVSELMRDYPGQIRAVFLGYRLIDSVTKQSELIQFGPSTENHWYKHLSQAELLELVNYLKKESEIMYKQTVEYKLPYFEISSIVNQAEEIIDYLLTS